MTQSTRCVWGQMSTKEFQSFSFSVACIVFGIDFVMDHRSQLTLCQRQPIRIRPAALQVICGNKWAVIHHIMHYKTYLVSEIFNLDLHRIFAALLPTRISSSPSSMTVHVNISGCAGKRQQVPCGDDTSLLVFSAHVVGDVPFWHASRAASALPCPRRPAGSRRPAGTIDNRY